MILKRLAHACLVAGIIAAVMFPITALAAGGSINLGKPTAQVASSPYFPLSGFHRVPKTVRQGSRAEVLVISSSAITSGPYGESEAGERWPIVKALEQFGTLTGLQPIDQPTYTFKFQGRSISEAGGSTVDWAHSTYRSRYVAFVHRDLHRYDSSQKTFVTYQRLSSAERALYNKYEKQAPRNAPSLPLIAVGNYLQVTSQIMTWGDLLGPPGPQNQPGSPLSFGTIQSALAGAKDPPDSTLVQDVNAEANIIMALICHADGMQPRRVCGRAVIKKLLRHVR